MTVQHFIFLFCSLEIAVSCISLGTDLRQPRYKYCTNLDSKYCTHVYTKYCTHLYTPGH